MSTGNGVCPECHGTLWKVRGVHQYPCAKCLPNGIVSETSIIALEEKPTRPILKPAYKE